MNVDPKRTVAELKELRELTGDEEGAQRVAWTDTWERAREWLRGKVADNGVGISAENLKRICTSGFTTRKNGHGFGLHSCVLAAKEMGGTLTARSDGPGQGAVFTLELPIKTAGDLP